MQVANSDIVLRFDCVASMRVDTGIVTVERSLDLHSTKWHSDHCPLTLN